MLLRSEESLEWLKDKDSLLLYELFVAYLLARAGGKRNTLDEHSFEVNEFENLIRLRDAIMNRDYRPSRGTVHIVFNPVIREIFAAPFVDRIVHHWIYQCIYDWWDRRFIYDSYSCREGKGTTFGIERASKHLQSVSKGYKGSTFVIKMDVQGYFMSIPRRELLAQALRGLDRQFVDNYDWRYETLRFLLREIIMDNPCKSVKRIGWPTDWRNLPASKSLFEQPPGVGIVIGNLTSQLLSNIYLDQLDRFVKYDLGYKHYGRYVDDFFLVVSEAELSQALADVERIKMFLRGLGLRLHPNKFSVQPIERGVEFLGAVVYPGRVYPGKRLKRNARRAFSEVVEGVRDVETVVSYLGHMKYMKSNKILANLFDKAGWNYNM